MMNNQDKQDITISFLLEELNSISEKLESLISATAPPLPSSLEDDQYYDVTEVAKLCRVARQTIYNWVSQGTLQANKSTGRLLFRQDDVNAFLSKRSKQDGNSLLKISHDEGDPLSEKELHALAQEQKELYDAERAYQIAHAYEINRPHYSHFNTCLIVKNRFHINSKELKRCCVLYNTWDPLSS